MNKIAENFLRESLVTTKYSAINIGLALLGVLLAAADALFAGVASIAAIELADDSWATVVVVIASITLLPVSLITLRWPTLSSAASWGIAVVCFACFVPMPVPGYLLFVIVSVGEALIARAVKRRSEDLVISIGYPRAGESVEHLFQKNESR